MNIKYIQHIPSYELVNVCEQIADDLNLEIIDTYEDGRGDEIVEDDGILHITRSNIRVAIDVSNNQQLSAKEQKANEAKVLNALKEWSSCDHSDARICQGLGH